MRPIEHAPDAAHARFLIGDRFSAEKTHLPGDDLIGWMRRGCPINFRLDIGDGMTGRQRRIPLFSIDQGPKLIHRGCAPSLPATHGFGRTTRDRGAPHIVDSVRFPFPSEIGLTVRDSLPIQNNCKSLRRVLSRAAPACPQKKTETRKNYEEKGRIHHSRFRYTIQNSELRISGRPLHDWRRSVECAT
jgi:hypothetical protein